jgi:hypothetical protein
MYLKNKDAYKSLNDEINHFGGGVKKAKHKRNKKIKEIYNALKKDVFDRYEYSDRDAILAEIFNFMLVICHIRDAVLIETFNPHFAEKSEDFVKALKKINNDYTNFLGDSIKFTTFENGNYIFAYFANSDKAPLIDELSVGSVYDNAEKYGKILGYECPGDVRVNGMVEDRMFVGIYSNDGQVYAFMCSIDNYEREKDLITEKFNNISEVARILEIPIELVINKIKARNDML